ncbi:hypothetical protein BASA81_006472 [Batrachochytrium salamandrivorans]|nr:hypothetical protein BASA81_006472 [Batrachochytrium salamandrivorans]
MDMASLLGATAELESPLAVERSRRKRELEEDRERILALKHNWQIARERSARELQLARFQKYHQLASLVLFINPEEESEAEALGEDGSALLSSKERIERVQHRQRKGEAKHDEYLWVVFCEHAKRLIPTVPLTKDERLYLNRQVYSPGRESEEIVDRYNAPINKICLRTLTKSTWVNDEIVNAYSQMCQHRTPQGLERTHLFSSFFLSSLGMNNEYKYEAVKKWTTPRRGGKVDLFSKRAVLIPINLHSVHWIFAFVDLRFKQIVVLDSMHGENADVYRALFRYLKDEHLDKKQCELPDQGEWKMIGGNRSCAPRQNNSDDCGVFSCMFANLLMEFFAREEGESSAPKPVLTAKLLSSFSCKDMPRIREQIQLDILRGEVFPATPQVANTLDGKA